MNWAWVMGRRFLAFSGGWRRCLRGKSPVDRRLGGQVGVSRGTGGAKECLGTAQVLEEAGENERLFFFGGLAVQQMLQALRDRGKRQDLFRHDGTRRQALVPRFEHWRGPQELALVHLVAKAIVRGWS